MKLASALRPAPQAAFTLIELMVGTAITAIVLGAAYACMNAGFQSQKLVESRVDVIQNARVAMDIIAADLRAATPLSADYDFLGLSRMLDDVEADNIDFATHHFTPTRPGESDFCEVSYFLSRDPETGETVLFRRRDATPDPLPLEGGIREEIARGLAGLRFEYYDGLYWWDDWGEIDPLLPEETDDEILTAFTNATGMPDAVRVTLFMSLDPPERPRRRRFRPTNTDTAKKQPPLAFQTVVHLNLAAATLLRSAVGEEDSENAEGGGE